MADYPSNDSKFKISQALTMTEAEVRPILDAVLLTSAANRDMRGPNTILVNLGKLGICGTWDTTVNVKIAGNCTSAF